MAQSTELVSTLRRDLAEVEARLSAHPWIAALEAGRLAQHDLALFAGQQRRIIASDLRSVALLVHRFGASASGRFFLEGLKTESAALEALDGFARALGLDERALAAMRRCSAFASSGQRIDCSIVLRGCHGL